VNVDRKAENPTISELDLFCPFFSITVDTQLAHYPHDALRSAAFAVERCRAVSPSVSLSVTRRYFV